ncbi:MAG: DNA-3-methyladenine glycosylase family protein [Candidatus Bathycorpusculaceae bacterium]
MSIQLNDSLIFNLDFTLCCGQSFRWEKLGKWWYGIVRDKAFKVRQVDNELRFEGVDKDFVMEYFGLYDDLPKILTQIAKDKHIKRAVEAFTGLRILRQDPWECLISYICATYKNIPAIKQMLSKLSKKFGEKRVFDGREFYTFPEPSILAKTKVADLAECGLGYRARYVLETAKKVNSDDASLEELKGKSYMDARSKLLSLLGVGLKVADCVLLFSLGKLEAFPVDVWVKRTVLRYYADHFGRRFVETVSLESSLTKSEYERLNFFGRSYFGEYAGYAQEYLYHFERTKTRLELFPSKIGLPEPHL